MVGMKKYVILVAGGKGSRMGSDLPKQFLELNGKPILMHTFEAFLSLEVQIEFILVLPADHISHWNHLCEIHDFRTPHQITEGGPHRFHSVKSGLKLVPEGALVAIHDAVRPFVSKEVIKRCFTMAERKGNAVPVIPLRESIRVMSGSLSKSVDRDKYKLVQTPQAFLSSALKVAYQQAYNERFTDDATVLENTGAQIFTVEGNKENIKITTPAELAIATSYSADQ